jgi:phospholipid/cholesterol/gamma-HCH transport system substrate-binding protein
VEIKETEARFVFLRGKVFLFIGVAFLGTLLLLFLIAKQRGLFMKTEEVYFIAERATGMYTGMPVKVSGFKIGRIKEMKLLDDARVKVVLSIESPQMKWLREDSYALLTKEGLIGESVIEIIPGKGRNLRPHEALNFEKLKGFEEMAQELKAELTVIIHEIKELLHYINSPQGDIKKSLANLEKVSEGLIALTSEAKVTIEDTDKLIKELDGSVANVTVKAEVTLDETRKRLEELSGLISDTRNSLNKITENIIHTTQNLKEATGKTSKDIPLLLQKTERSLQDVEEILQSIKGLWPLRSGIKKEAVRPLSGDTYAP